MPRLIAGNKTIDCKLIIFDKDGTLVDYHMVDLELAKARRKSVEKIVGRDAADLWEKVVGVNLRTEKIDYQGPLGTLPTRDELLVAATAFYLKGYPWEEARQLAEKTYAEADNSMRPPYGSILLEGVRENLEKLRERGFRLAIASTDAHSRIVEVFRILKIDGLFDAFVGPEDVANGKPAPDMIFEVLRRTGCRADESVMVGDSMSDMRMGKNAKVKACIGVLTGITRRQKLEELADVVIASVVQLDVFQNRRPSDAPI
jgi:HAD superfamily hydrolase (TIGR01549 family)